MKAFKIISYTFLLAAITIVLSGCSLGMKTNYEYKNAEKFTAGDRNIKDQIEVIDIDYRSGDIVLTGTSSDEVTIHETAKVDLDEKRQVHTWVDGKTLYIRYCASAKGLDLEDLEKHLEIGIPEKQVLKDLTTAVSSGDLAYSGFETENLSIEASSGEIKVDTTAKTTDIVASSGDITLKLHGDSEIVNLETSSGEISVDLENSGELKAETSSGKIEVNAVDLKEITAESSSGLGLFSFQKMPERAKLSASSGDITVSLPEDADFTAHIDTSSGDFSYDLPLSKSEDGYVCGNGTNTVTINTSSGDIQLLKY